MEKSRKKMLKIVGVYLVLLLIVIAISVATFGLASIVPIFMAFAYGIGMSADLFEVITNGGRK